MPLRDLQKQLKFTTSFGPAARTATANGTGVDLSGWRTAAVFWHVGTITDGTHTPTVEESDDNSSYTAVAAADLDGTLAALASNTNQKVGYKGTKRYIRAVITCSGTTTGGVYAATVVQGTPLSV